MRFPVEKLKIEEVKFAASAGTLSMEIYLKPFEYFDGEETKTEKTSIVLPDIDLSQQAAFGLAGKSLKFPTNPIAGYIDGSIYIQHAHHPVDVTLIEFKEATNTDVPAQITTNILLSYEGLGEYDNAPWTFEVAIPKVVLAGLC